MDILRTKDDLSRGTRQVGSQSPTFRIRLQQQMADYEDRMRERIIQAREESGLSPEELALRAGLSAKQVRRIEKGQSRNPHMSTVRAIAEATGRDVTWIRPDLEAEEAELQAQLDRLEGKLDWLIQAAQASAPAGKRSRSLADPPPLRSQSQSPSQATGKPQNQSQGRRRKS